LRKVTDPFDAMALFLSEVFSKKVSITLVFDVFLGLCVMVIAAIFVFNIKKISKDRDRDK